MIELPFVIPPEPHKSWLGRLVYPDNTELCWASAGCDIGTNKNKDRTTGIAHILESLHKMLYTHYMIVPQGVLGFPVKQVRIYCYKDSA